MRLFFAVFCFGIWVDASNANEFDHLITEPGREKIAKELSLYKKSFKALPFEYSSIGHYLDYSRKSYRETANLKFDDAGLPMVRSRDKFLYNPVTLGQFALSVASDGTNPDLFSVATRKLLELQSEDGAFRYNYPFRHYTNASNYAPGWVSGMAQGVVLSALARAYHQSKDERYKSAGNKALSFLQVKHPYGPMTDLGDLKPEWSNKIWFQEYLTDPHVYTLNGYMFTLLGLYDWAQVTESSEAKDLFDQGMETLLIVLPLYDMGNFTAYDLSFITHPESLPYLEPRLPHVAARYHKVHIDLLNALHQITGNETVRQYEEAWRKQVSLD